MSGAWLSSAQVGPALPASCRGRRRFSQVKKPTVWEVNSSAQGCLARRGQSPKGPIQPASQPLLMGLGLCRNSRARPGSPGLGKCHHRDRAHAGMRVRRAGLGLVPAQLLTGSVTLHTSCGLAGFVVSPVQQVRAAAVCSGEGLRSVTRDRCLAQQSAREGFLGCVVLRRISELMTWSFAQIRFSCSRPVFRWVPTAGLICAEHGPDSVISECGVWLPVTSRSDTECHPGALAAPA